MNGSELKFTASVIPAPSCYTAPMLRGLRIAASVFFAVATVIIAALWMRSYDRFDSVSRVGRDAMVTTFTSDQGIVGIARSEYGTATKIIKPEWMVWGFLFEPQTPADVKRQREASLPHSRWWFKNIKKFSVYFPYWLLVLSICAVAIVLWIPWAWQFSIRTMLIATAVFAVMLGSIVSMSR